MLMFSVATHIPTSLPRIHLKNVPYSLSESSLFVKFSGYALDGFMLYTCSDRLCGLVVRVPGYRTEMYCDSCEVRTEFIYVM
jgi:hypothetical protein